jgi:type II secretory pathway component PulF
MDTELKNRLDTLEQKVDTINKNIKTIKSVFLWTFIITIAVIVIPLIGMIFVIPQFMSSIDISGYSQLLGI